MNRLFRNLNRGYRNLDVWNEAVQLSIKVRKKIRTMYSVSFKLRGQIEDSMISVPSNIAEGYSRRYIKEYIQHLNYALGSLSENYTQLYILKETTDIDEEWFTDYDEKHYSLENKLLALSRKLLKENKDEWNEQYKIK